MLKRFMLPMFALVLTVMVYSQAAHAAQFVQSFGTAQIQVIQCLPSGEKDSSEQSVTVRESNISSTATVKSVVFEAAREITYDPKLFGAIRSIEAIVTAPNGRKVRKTWGIGNKTTFTAADFGPESTFVKGKWTVAYRGKNLSSTLQGMKSHNNLSLTFTY